MLDSHSIHIEVPRADNSCLISPELSDARDLIEFNRAEISAHSQARFFDTTIGQLRAATRANLLVLARDWTRDTVPNPKDSANCACAFRQNELLARVEQILSGGQEDSPPLILSGHQPEIFHTGVWFKNAVISKLANLQEGIAINLVIDHDLPKHVGINVPVLANDSNVTLRSVAPIRVKANVPWEVLDSHADIDVSFPEEARIAAKEVLLQEPLIDEYWKYFLESVQQGTAIGHSIAVARHRLERERGWNSLELPMSKLCDTWEFGTFVAEIISRSEELQAIYNEAREDYRRDHRLRNEAHPVPALSRLDAENEHWCELPFWIYSEENPKRRQLWLCRDKRGYSLRDREQLATVVKLGDGPVLSRDLWESMVESGTKIRPRALMTTTFLRLFAADLFVHGIGGGKYDQVTDQIISQMWGIQAPKFIVASASLYLPMSVSPTNVDTDTSQLQKRIRDVKYHPETLLKQHSHASPELDALLRKKESLISSVPHSKPSSVDGTNALATCTSKREWHHQIELVNLELGQHLNGLLEVLAQQIEQSRIRERQQRILKSREFSFVLFSKTNVFERLEAFLPAMCEVSTTHSVGP